MIHSKASNGSKRGAYKQKSELPAAGAACQGRRLPHWSSSSCYPLCTGYSHRDWLLAEPHPWSPLPMKEGKEHMTGSQCNLHTREWASSEVCQALNLPTTSLWRKTGRWRRRSPKAKGTLSVLTRRSWTLLLMRLSSPKQMPNRIEKQKCVYAACSVQHSSGSENPGILWRCMIRFNILMVFSHQKEGEMLSFTYKTNILDHLIMGNNFSHLCQKPGISKWGNNLTDGIPDWVDVHHQAVTKYCN